MHGLAVVPQSLLREPFRVADRLGSFRPCVAVAVKRDASNAQLAAALSELRGSVASPHARQIRKQHSLRWQVFEQVQCLRAQVDNDGHAGFLAEETHRVVRPVHVLAFQIRNVTLTCAQVPAQLVKQLSFGVHLGGDDPLVFVKRDGAFVLVTHLRPLAFRQNWPRQPVHVQGEIVNAAQINVR